MTLTEQPTARTVPTRPQPATGGEHLLTVVFGLWMTVGLFLDGYFHQNLDRTTESFVTPWHAVFYAGFTASALWLGSMARRRSDDTMDWTLRNVPPGYDGARLGLVLFAVGGIGDAVWHQAYGVERGIDALLSPTHLLLFTGLLLILTAPWRAAIVAPSTGPTPWMIVGSVVSAAALTGFFVNFVWGLGIAGMARVPYDPVTDAGEVEVIAGVASMLVTTVVFVGAARVLLSVGRPPAGALVLLFGTVALLVSTAFDEDIEGVAAAIAAGMVVEMLLHVRRWKTAPALATAATVLWLTYLSLLEAFDGIEWQEEIWIGAVLVNGLAAYGIASMPTSNRTEKT